MNTRPKAPDRGALPAEIQTRRNRALGLAEKIILGFIAGAAVAVGVVQLVQLIQRIVSLATGPVRLTGVPLATDIEPDFLGGASAAVYDSVSFTMGELSAGGRAALIGAALASSLLVVGICVVLAWLSIRVFLGKPFVTSATWGIGVVAILVIVTGLLGPLLTGGAQAEAALALGVDELPVLLVEVDLGPIAWGGALAVIAAAFELGQRLQRDTEGLV